MPANSHPLRVAPTARQTLGRGLKTELRHRPGVVGGARPSSLQRVAAQPLGLFIRPARELLALVVRRQQRGSQVAHSTQLTI